MHQIKKIAYFLGYYTNKVLAVDGWRKFPEEGILCTVVMTPTRPVIRLKGFPKQQRQKNVPYFSSVYFICAPFDEEVVKNKSKNLFKIN